MIAYNDHEKKSSFSLKINWWCIKSINVLSYTIQKRYNIIYGHIDFYCCLEENRASQKYLNLDEVDYGHVLLQIEPDVWQWNDTFNLINWWIRSYKGKKWETVLHIQHNNNQKETPYDKVWYLQEWNLYRIFIVRCERLYNLFK